MKRTALLAILLVVLVSSVAQAGEWHEKITLGGDFRDRYDGIWDDTKDYVRHRNRIRARLSLKASITEDFTFLSRFATGINDPASTNRTLTDGFTTKGYWLDLAYFDFHPVKAPGLHIYGGKMKNSFYKPAKQQLVWDGDVNPEGLAINLARDASEKVAYWLVGSWYSVEERKADPDIYMIGAQGGLKVKTSDKVKIGFGASYYGYENLKGSEALFDGEFFGNSTTLDADSNEVFANDFRIVEGFAEIGIKAGKATWTVWGAYANNIEADSLNMGWLAGLGLKGGKGKGAWKLAGFYKYVETDAVIGLFADSDFGGGTTDVKGFAISGGYAVAKNVELASTLFVNERGVEDGTSFTRLFLDLKMKF
jgi:hypothetical protein